jgi:hypothetical protein
VERFVSGNAQTPASINIDHSQSSVNGLDSHPTPANQFIGEAGRDDELPVQDKEDMQPSRLEAAKKAQQAWSIGMKCTWLGCSSKAAFKTQASFNTHLKNAHSRPLLCVVLNCPHKTPFGRKSDLRRHYLSAHSAQRTFVCTVPSCDARIKEFARKDHLTKHMRERHDNYFCPVNHCNRSKKSSFDNPESVAEHIEKNHGSYECALGACAVSAASKFCLDSLRSHLRNDHDMDGWATRWVNKRRHRRQSMTVLDTDLGQASWIECKVCGKQQHVAEK